MFWALLAAGVFVTLLGLPVGDDATLMKAVEELSGFAKSFDRGALERTLLAHASQQGYVGIDVVARDVRGRSVPKLAAVANAAPIAPRAAISLSTLDNVQALTAPNARVPIGSPKPAQLSQSLAWRLTRQPSAERFELAGITLSDARCAQADIDREQQVATEREHVLDARAKTEKAQKQSDDAAQLSELRRKWHAPWKAILKADEHRTETQAALDAAKQELANSEQSYAAIAKQAEAFAGTPAGKAGAQEGEIECAVAVAKLIERPSGRAFELKLPAPIDRREVPVPRITGAEFPVLTTSGFWDELKGGTAEQAIERLNERFSWHYRHIDIGGLKVGGMTLLQFAPMVLLPFFFGLMRRSRGVGATYNPFGASPQVEDLPTVGFGSEALNLIVLVALPLAGSVLCAWSLLQISQVPIVPGLCALAALGLGATSHVALKELLELRDAITRSHSNPPPAPSTNT
jgi:hypothetical protein